MPTIRPATDDDRVIVASLMKAYSNETAAGSTAGQDDQVFLAENDVADPIGFVSLNITAQGSSATSIGEVIALYVTPTNRRRRIAMLLLAEAERTSRDQGIAELNTRFDDANATAAAFFRTMGYTQTGTGFSKQLPPKRSAKSRRAEG